MKSYQLKSHVVCLFFSKSIYSFIRPGTQVRYGINGWIPFFVSHLSQHLISFPNSYSNNLLSLSHPDHSRTIQPLSHFPTDFLPTAALIPSSASEQPKWLQKAEMTCWALLSSHHLHKKVTCSQVNPLSDVFSPVVQQEYWLAALC